MVAVLGDEAGSPTSQAMSRAVFGGGLYLTLIGLMSFAFGALPRNSAAAITTMPGIVIVPEVIGVFAGGLFGMERLGTVAIHYSPMNIAASLFRIGHDPETNSVSDQLSDPMQDMVSGVGSVHLGGDA